MITATPGVLQNADPRRWREHHFGLPEERWAALRGRSVWITGAGSGFGRAMAVALAAAGAQVFLTGRQLHKLQETLQEMRGLGVTTEACQLVSADLTDRAQVEAAADQIRCHCPHLYGLVNSAALPQPRASEWPLMNMVPEEWDALLSTNVTGSWLVTRAILPHMVAGGAVRAIFVTSEAGWAFTPGFGPYNVTKAALNSLGACMAAESAAAHPEVDIQVNVLIPGEARTEMNQNSTDSPYTVVSMALILLSHPAGGPNGKFFHRDGRHLPFAYATPYERSLLGPETAAGQTQGAAATSAGRRAAISRLLALVRSPPGTAES